MRSGADGIKVVAETAEPSVFFALSSDLFCVAGADGYFKILNPAWTRFLGWTVRQMLAKPFIEFVHTDDRDATLTVFEKLKQGGEAVQFENRYRCRDGAYRWLQWNATWHGQDRLIYAIARDVTNAMLLQQQLLEITEREKRLISADIHDGLCQHLAGVAIMSMALTSKLRHAECVGYQESAEISHLIQEAVEMARHLAHGMNPVRLDHQHFLEALADLATEFQSKTGIGCTCRGDNSVTPADTGMAMHLYRIARESVANAIKHSQCTQINIHLSQDVSFGILTVDDNGIGMRTKRSKTSGMGLHLIRYRANLIRAKLTIRRRLGGGTTVQCRFKLKREPSKQRQEPSRA